jgi:uncharacterized repeat protein (TIGR03803 family)
MYGTTRYGGAVPCGGSPVYGCGTAYKITPTGKLTWQETKIYDFGSGNDGKEPNGGFYLDGSGNLWGTTLGGGLNPDSGQNKGTVFELMPSGPPWTELCRLSFDDGFYGGYSFAGLVPYSGNLYGVSADAGSGMSGGAGTFFQVNCSANGPSPLQVFSGTKFDLQGPRGTLVGDGHGNFYGTTATGGLYGYGSVFKVTPSTGPQTLYNFCATRPCTDGAYPSGDLLFDSTGTVLYGTTYSGGNFPTTCPQGCGTIFKFTL